ncbi:undecaprenyl-diphosphatase [Microbacterium halimionae]|uniref:Undecaprenyl-diphosphatase n=1 Tax=Microbacterium halimionae TaxID=1526413 RepID=A0A7W3JM49_9MICO|nr:phosphatase PAP2 family protein [Microbacterium halimionae]MBA8815421.1 undecaprenyl-diphosphatase [Microbacterium halimionae]NII95468.1 undecaprenyl-diphosphatase [Microbacterium halimionae]
MTSAAPVYPAFRQTLLRVLLPVALVCIALACGLGAWTRARGPVPFAIDTAWNDLLAATASPVLLWFAQLMNTAGGVFVSSAIVPVAGVITLLIVRRPWAAVYVVVTLLASNAAVQIFKHLFGRARPEDIIVVSDYGSFPSGHVANAATLAVLLAVLVPRTWTYIMGAVWVVLMAFSRTYLHAHWLTDTVGGALVGVGVALLITIAFSRLLPRRTWRQASEENASSE